MIIVLAGTNGAGKSSVAGEALRQSGGEYFNPDEAARRLMAVDPRLSLEEANSIAWDTGRRMLARAIDEGLRFAFETTLGGRTITAMLRTAADQGIAVRIWYVGLASPELHRARVVARVARGGHDIPEEWIRKRYDDSRRNLISLLPHLAELKLYDNSREADPATGRAPAPALVLHLKAGRVVDHGAPADVPDWAKPIVQAAIRLRSSE